MVPAQRVVAEPGVRVPRAVDGFEIAVRAIVGQQISVAGAITVLGRLVAAAPDPDEVDVYFWVVGGTGTTALGAEMAPLNNVPIATASTAPLGAA